MSADDIVDHDFVTAGKTITISVPRIGASERPGRHPGIALEIGKDAPDRFHWREKVTMSEDSTSQAQIGTDRARILRLKVGRRTLSVGRSFPRRSGPMIIEQIFISPGHNYFGHHGRPPDDFPLVAARASNASPATAFAAIASSIIGDDYKGQITFFSAEVFDELAQRFWLTEKSPGVLRRNVIVSGIDLNELDRCRFRNPRGAIPRHRALRALLLDGHAFAPGAEEFLAGRGGLRAQILTDGLLRRRRCAS